MLDKLMSGIGKGIESFGGNFLSNIGSSLGNAAGSQITNAIFGRQDRISNKDFQFYQDLIDSTIPREIQRNQDMMEAMTPWDIWRTNELNRGTLNADVERQNAFTTWTTDADIGREKAFLEHIAPAQADAYNVQQDMTYGEDTRRANERVLETSKALGMSPWELKGVTPTGPINVPLPDAGARNAAPMSNASGKAEFLSSVAQPLIGAQTTLQTAQLQAQTSKEIARMNNETQLKIAGQATADGEVPRREAALKGAQEATEIARKVQTEAQTGQINAQTKLTAVQSWSQWLEGIKGIAGTEEVNLGTYKWTRPANADLIARLGALQSPAEGFNSAAEFANNLDDKQFEALAAEMIGLARFIGGALGGAAKGIKGVVDFLGRIGR